MAINGLLITTLCELMQDTKEAAMPKPTNQEILDTALRAKADILAGRIPNRRDGLCKAFFRGFGSGLDSYFKTWKHFSGCLTYPVPATAKRWQRGAGSNPVVAAALQYECICDKYRGEQKYLRLDLLDHIITMCGGDTTTQTKE